MISTAYDMPAFVIIGNAGDGVRAGYARAMESRPPQQLY
jgi:hypothetical protein